jgi:tRNA(Ile2) C34 agmatinyltransferase TiaS
VDVVLPNHQVVSIVNAQGKVVLLSEVRAKQHRIDISSLKPGIYIVTAEGVRPERLVVKP